MTKNILLAATALVLFSGVAHATLTTSASLYQMQSVGGTVTPISIQGVTAPSNTAIVTPAYTVSFAVPNGQGVVHSALATQYAIPVAGTTNGGTTPTYLTGDYNSAQTANAGAAGNYFSTGIGSITISFNTLQNAIALLWGSIDTFNTVSFYSGATLLDTLTGATVQSDASGFVSNGFQGPGGSAYVSATESTQFDRVVFSSTSNSFEFAAVAGSTTSFAIPEPISMAVFGSGLALAGLVRARRRQA